MVSRGQSCPHLFIAALPTAKMACPLSYLERPTDVRQRRWGSHRFSYSRLPVKQRTLLTLDAVPYVDLGSITPIGDLVFILSLGPQELIQDRLPFAHQLAHDLSRDHLGHTTQMPTNPLPRLTSRPSLNDFHISFGHPPPIVGAGTTFRRSFDSADSSRVSWDDPTWKVIPIALKTYKHNNHYHDDNWENYAMLICYGPHR